MRYREAIGTALTVAWLAVLPVAADDPARFTGEVVGLRHAVSTRNQAELDRLTVRARNGEVHHVLLGEAGSCPDCVTVGDRVRLRVMAGGPAGEPLRVRTMQVRRTGENFTFRSESGDLVRTRAGRHEAPGARNQGVRHRASAGGGRGHGAGGPRR